MKFLFVLLAAFLLLSCSQPSQPSLFSFGDSGTSRYRPHVCQPALVGRDIYNCGECGNICAASDSDICVSGICRCGLSLPCGHGADCRVGRCILTDITGDTCEFDDWCLPGYACIESRCTFINCVPEICDGFDNDCDGIVDNNGAGPLAEYCYSGPSSMPITLPCQQGIRTCISGSWTDCVGEVTPSDEVGIFGCDGVDNNCDGCVDGVLLSGVCVSREPDAFDVLFVIDQSGSMTGKISIVKQAVRLFSARLSANPAFRWGIVLVPGSTQDGVNELYQDLTTFPAFEVSLRAITGSGGIEPQWDAIYEAVNGEMGVSWILGSVRIIILFTDERGQSRRATRGLVNVTEADMCAAMTNGELLVSVVSPAYQEDFDDCAHRIMSLPLGSAGSGDPCISSSECSIPGETCQALECVTSVVTNMADSLGGIISNPCRGGI